jgi:hypothetical protein
MRLLFALILVLLLPSTAAAAEITLSLKQPGGVEFGAKHEVVGVLTQDGVPLAGQPVVIEGRPFPYDGEFAAVEQVTTGADGAFSAAHAFDRNEQIHASAPAQGVVSETKKAFVFPASALSFKDLGDGFIRLIQKFRVPRDAKLKKKTLFYAGPRNAKRAPVVAKAKPRKTSPGHFKSTARFELPESWNGRFQYASCFRYTRGSGLGDPGSSCPRRFRF